MNLPLIEKEAPTPKGGDYQALFREGLDRVSQYSGELWNNYNLSDPGVTILQSLCYALTELNYKTNLPIEDLLTRADGQMVYKDRFVLPESILPVNPVTLTDFKKLVADHYPALKQVYFNLEDNIRFFNTFQPYLELKPESLPLLKDETFRSDLIHKVRILLEDHANLGQLFLEPRILEPQVLHISGRIELETGLEPEHFIGLLLYRLNNYLSPYPKYRAYRDLREQGLSNDQIFVGPLCRNGFLEDSDFPNKPLYLDPKALSTMINDLDGVVGVEHIEIGLGDSGVIAEQLEIPLETAPYLSVDSLLQGDPALEIVQNGHVLTQLSRHKIQYAFSRRIPAPQPLPDLQAALPKGNYRNVRQYYSVQHHFPQNYQLTARQDHKDKDPVRLAKIRQLKGYLALPEQIMANFLAQLSQVGDLFSFDSGRNLFRLTGNTYYFQDLYNVPGIQALLRDVKGYSRRAGEGSRQEDWDAYRRDHLNPYRQELIAASESMEVNLDRKSRVLRHLLARFGSRYQPNYLFLNNPDYGDGRTAEVSHISQTLKAFPGLSANRGRTYYRESGHAEQFLSGFERTARNDLSLNSYYQGVDEMIRQALEMDPQSLSVLYYDREGEHLLFGQKVDHPCGRAPVPGIEVYHDQKLLLAFAHQTVAGKISLKALEDLLCPYLILLRDLERNGAGFVFIDNIRLLEGLNFQWEIRDRSGESYLYRSQLMGLSSLESMLSLLYRGAEPGLNSADGLWSIEVGTGSQARLILESSNKQEVTTIHQALLRLRRGADTLRVWAINEAWEKLELKTSLFQSRISAVFPDWVALLWTPQYQRFLQDRLLTQTPLDTRLDIYSLDPFQMQRLLSFFSLWMAGRKMQARSGNKMDGWSESEAKQIALSRTAAWEIVNLLIQENENTK